MKHGIALMLLAILASAANAQTQFYKCKDKWGQPIFSQRPCGDNAETGTVSGPAPTGTPARTTANASAATSESSSAWDKIEAANTLREANLEKERDQNLVALQNKKRYADNNLRVSPVKCRPSTNSTSLRSTPSDERSTGCKNRLTESQKAFKLLA